MRKPATIRKSAVKRSKSRKHAPGKRAGRPRKDEAAQGAASSRERILQAASALFAAEGFERPTLESVASRAGYSIGSIYHRFGSKAELLLQVVREALEFYRIPHPFDGQAAPAEAWPDFAMTYLVPQNRQLRRLIAETVNSAGRDAALAAVLRPLTEEVTSAIARSVEAGQRDGRIDPGIDAVHAAQLFMLFCSSLMHLDVLYPETFDDEAWKHAVLRTLRGAIGLDPAGSAAVAPGD